MSTTGTASIYVGDLADTVTEELLEQKFCSVGKILSVRVCREPSTGQSKNYGYVNFARPEDAQLAVETLNHVVICGQPARVMPSQRDAQARKSGKGNVFVKNLHQEQVTNKLLHDHFKQFGAVLSAKVAVDNSRRSRGYGFVQYAEPDSARHAIEALNSTEFCGQILTVQPFTPAKDRTAEPGKFFNIYVKNIGNVIDEEGLRTAFSRFGPITSTVVMCNSQNKSRGFGFVNFKNSDDAAQAVREMDGHENDGLRWKVTGARRRDDTAPKPQQQQLLDRTVLSIRNLSLACTESDLRPVFEEFGPVESIRLTRASDGANNGAASVQFMNPEDAEAAITGLNGQKIRDFPVPIVVTLAPRRRPAQEPQPANLPQGTTASRSQAAPSSSSTAYNMPPVQPVMAPNVAYYPGPTLFYGPPIAMQQGQQQVAATFMQMQAPTTRHPILYDQMSGLMTAPGAAAYPGQPTPQIGALHPLVRMNSSSGVPFISYDSHAAASQQYWQHDAGNNPLLDSARQDHWGQRSRGYQQRPMSPLQAPAPFMSAALHRRPAGLSLLEAQNIPGSGLHHSDSILQRPTEQLQQLPQTRMLSETSLSFSGPRRSSTTGRPANVDDLSAQGNLLARTAGLFTTEAAVQLFQDVTLPTHPPSTTSAFDS